MSGSESKRIVRGVPDMASGLFSLILSLRGKSDYGDIEDLRQRILRYLKRIDEEGRRAGIPGSDLEDVKYPLVAFIDETILSSQWEFADQWRESPLQLDLFGDRRGATRFFEQLEEVKREGAAKQEILEVYFLCLALGFQGKYGISASKGPLEVTIDDLRRLLGHAKSGKDRTISPHGITREGLRGGPELRLPTWRLAMISMAATLLGFVLLFFVMERITQGVLRSLPVVSS